MDAANNTQGKSMKRFVQCAIPLCAVCAGQTTFMRMRRGPRPAGVPPVSLIWKMAVGTSSAFEKILIAETRGRHAGITARSLFVGACTLIPLSLAYSGTLERGRQPHLILEKRRTELTQKLESLQSLIEYFIVP